MIAQRQNQPPGSHSLLQKTVTQAFVRVPDVRIATLDFAESVGEVFHARRDEEPIVTMKIEGDDPTATPYASCRMAELSLHTDYATFAEPPRFTITHCIEPDPAFPALGQSIVVQIDDVLVHLRDHEPALDRILREKRFPFRRNAEHQSYHCGRVPEFPILEGDLVRFDSTLILPALEESTDPDRDAMIQAVRRFEELCHQLGRRSAFALDQHEALITDNRRVVHSRGPCSVTEQDGRLVSREVNLVFLV